MRINAKTGDNDVDMAINNVAGLVDILKRGCPMLEGTLIKAVRIPVTTTVSIPHGLGRAWRGWRQERLYQNATLTTAGVLVEDSVSRRDTHLTLRSLGFDAPIFVDLWVW